MPGAGFTAEHNTYVFKNYGYACPREPATLRRSPAEDKDTPQRELTVDFEQNPDLGDPSPTSSRRTRSTLNKKQFYETRSKAIGKGR